MTYTIIERGRGRKTMDDDAQPLYPDFETADAAVARAHELAASDLKDGRYATSRAGSWTELGGVLFFEYGIAVPRYEIWAAWGDENERIVDAVSARDIDTRLDALCCCVDSHWDNYVLGNVCWSATTLDVDDGGNRLVKWDGFFGECQAIIPGAITRDGSELLPRDGAVSTDFASVDDALASNLFTPARESDAWQLYAEVIEVAILAAL